MRLADSWIHHEIDNVAERPRELEGHAADDIHAARATTGQHRTATCGPMQDHIYLTAVW